VIHSFRSALYSHGTFAILKIVREGEAGRKVADLCRTNGITEQTYYRWKAKYGGMELSEMHRLKQREDENRRLKQIVAEQTLDIQALKARDDELLKRVAYQFQTKKDFSTLFRAK
jgi:putative transposase